MHKKYHRSICVSEIRDNLRAMTDYDFNELYERVEMLILIEGDELIAGWLGRFKDYLIDEKEARIKLKYKRLLHEDIPYPEKRR